MSDADRQAFLSAMPEDLRAQLTQQYQEELREQEQSQVTTTNAEKLAFYAALPPEIREQVMAEEARQERALGSTGSSSGGGGGGGGGSSSGGGGSGSPPMYSESQGDSKENEEQVTNDVLDALNGDSNDEDLLSFNNPS